MNKYTNQTCDTYNIELEYIWPPINVHLTSETAKIDVCIHVLIYLYSIFSHFWFQGLKYPPLLAELQNWCTELFL